MATAETRVLQSCSQCVQTEESVLTGKSEASTWTAIQDVFDKVFGVLTFRSFRLTGHLHEIDSDKKFDQLFNKAFDIKRNKKAKSQLVVVQFSAKWCGPCNMLTPSVKEFAKRYKTVVFIKVDVDGAKEVTTRYNIGAYPTTLFIRNKQEEKRLPGYMPDDIEKEVLVYLKNSR